MFIEPMSRVLGISRVGRGMPAALKHIFTVSWYKQHHRNISMCYILGKNTKCMPTRLLEKGTLSQFLKPRQMHHKKLKIDHYKKVLVQSNVSLVSSKGPCLSRVVLWVDPFMTYTQFWQNLPPPPSAVTHMSLNCCRYGCAEYTAAQDHPNTAINRS